MNNNPIFSNAVDANGIFEVAENHPSWTQSQIVQLAQLAPNEDANVRPHNLDDPLDMPVALTEAAPLEPTVARQWHRGRRLVNSIRRVTGLERRHRLRTERRLTRDLERLSNQRYGQLYLILNRDHVGLGRDSLFELATEEYENNIHDFTPEDNVRAQDLLRYHRPDNI